jgi:hypothetical protein
LSDKVLPVEDLYIANMDRDDNIDDILRLERQSEKVGHNDQRLELIWWRSQNGTQRWKEFKRHSFIYHAGDVNVIWDDDAVVARLGFAGRFGVAPNGGTLAIEQRRIGQFYSPGGPEDADWESLFPY